MAEEQSTSMSESSKKKPKREKLPKTAKQKDLEANAGKLFAKGRGCRLTLPGANFLGRGNTHFTQACFEDD
jgi:hypothetical protein